MNKRETLMALAACAGGVLLPQLASAQATLRTARPPVKFRMLHAFGAAGSAGKNPLGGLLQASDGYFYGTTTGGLYGAGTVFRFRPGGQVAEVHKFSGPDGADPVGGLIQARDGHIYGCTSRGGSDDEGTIFRLTPDGHLTTLFSFTYRGSVGYLPRSGLMEARDGHLYGCTTYGPNAGSGTVYRMSLDGGVELLYAFAFEEARENKSALIQAADGRLYGTSYVGGAYGDGTVYRLTLDGEFTILKSFEFRGDKERDGYGPRAALLEGIDGRLYGTVSTFFDDRGGMVFSITTAGVYDIQARWSEFTLGGDATYCALVQDAAGHLYGSTDYDYDRSTGLIKGGGSVFRLAPGGRLDVVHAFDIERDGAAAKQLVFGNDGRLYGTASLSGPDDAGTLFALGRRRGRAAGVAGPLSRSPRATTPVPPPARR